ncbi:MAG: hypothetical protein M1820_000012 [Bogoriella megaspora]|nr:MAG: hypothetical protein M1820_000012 [Bogoriella megaspora]
MPATASSSSSSIAPPERTTEVERLEDEDAGDSAPLLQRDEHENIAVMKTKAGTTLGLVRVWWLAFIVNLGGGFLFGYDSGVRYGFRTSFLAALSNDFLQGAYSGPLLPSRKISTTGRMRKDILLVMEDLLRVKVSSLAVSLQQLGGFVSCILVWPLTNAIGRRKTLMISSVTFCIGAMIQTINTHSLAAFYVARVIAGLGLGAATVVVPMFTSEMAPKEIRASLGSMFQWMYTWGIFLSYWVDYGVQRDHKANSAQWQIPISLQLVPAGLLGLSMFTVTESVRWLTKKGRHEEAWQSLKWIRADDSDITVAEMDEIRYGVEMEFQATEGLKFAELFQSVNFKPLALAFAVFTAQQATGATAFAYYSTQYFKALVGGTGTQNLLLAGLFGAVKVVACAFFVFFFADRFNRRTVLTLGASFMAACQISTAVVTHYRPPPNPPATGETHISSSGIATVALIFMFVIAYNLSWGPLPWPYVSEIFSTRIREPGVATGVAAQWLFNFVFTLTTPYMIQNLGTSGPLHKTGWGTFLLWGLFDTVIAIFSWTVIKETKGKSLEQIANVDNYAPTKSLVEETPNKSL